MKDKEGQRAEVSQCPPPCPAKTAVFQNENDCVEIRTGGHKYLKISFYLIWNLPVKAAEAESHQNHHRSKEIRPHDGEIIRGLASEHGESDLNVRRFLIIADVDSKQWRNALGSNLDPQHPVSVFSTRGARNRFPDKCRALKTSSPPTPQYQSE